MRSEGDIFRKFTSVSVGVMGSPMGTRTSFNEMLEETVTNGGEPGNEGGGVDIFKVISLGFVGALLILSRSRIEV